MSSRPKNSTQSKKAQNSNSMKEVLQQSQHTNELLRINISRAEDIAIIKAISDRKTGRLRLQTKLAEKTLSEAEYKEEWRLIKEDSILSHLINVKFDTPPQKKHLEKISRKILRVNMQFEDDPDDNDLNLSEIHVQNIMNVKIGPENTFLTYNEKGETYVSVPQGSVNISTWREQYSKPIKILEACLYGEVLNVFNVLSHCIKHSRQNFELEVMRQRTAIEQGISTASPNISVIITSKQQNKSSLNLSKKTSNSPTKKSSGQPLPEIEWEPSMVRMLLDNNTEIDKGIKSFIIEYNERQGKQENDGFSAKEKTSHTKAIRARNYEKYPPVNPLKAEYQELALSSVRTLKKIQTIPEILFDLDNPYFDEKLTVEQRVKIIHSCVVIQKAWEKKKLKIYTKSAIMIQGSIRIFLAKRKLFLRRIDKFRRIFFWERLKHWYPLIANKFREKKSKFNANKEYLQYLYQIRIIQRIARGYIARKTKIYWTRKLKEFVKRSTYTEKYRKKQSLWKVSIDEEEASLNNTQNIMEELLTVKLQLDDKSKRRNEKDLLEYINNLEKCKMEYRRQYMTKARNKRLLLLD